MDSADGPSSVYLHSYCTYSSPFPYLYVKETWTILLAPLSVDQTNPDILKAYHWLWPTGHSTISFPTPKAMRHCVPTIDPAKPPGVSRNCPYKFLAVRNSTTTRVKSWGCSIGSM